MENAISLYNNKCKMYINFMLSQQQWSGLTKPEVLRWLENFRDLKPAELYFVFKLLTNLIYFSEKDVLEALKEGIYYCLNLHVFLERQIQSDFCLSKNALFNIAKDELKKTCFVPLLDNDSPHESGNYVSRLLVQHGLINQNQSIFLSEFLTKYRTLSFTQLVIIDDCVGSGDQLRDFWNKATINFDGKIILLKEFCAENSISANYLTLFGYDLSINILRDQLPDLKIVCVRSLNDVHRVFSESSYVWSNTEERKSAYDLFLSLTQNCGIPLLGYKELDFAFIMHQTIPDWSLPLFWKENSEWNLLMRRKNSNG